MATKSDKTKKLLEDTLVNLMCEKDFSKISVKDITDKLDINRGTFYIHFKDKYDLLEQKENQILKELDGIIISLLKELHNNFILPSDKKVLLCLFTHVYSYIKENANFMKIVLGPNGDLNFQMKFKNFIENWLIHNIFRDDDTKKFPIKYLAPLASSAQLGIIQNWIKSGMQETPQELATFVSNVIFIMYNGVIKEMH